MTDSGVTPVPFAFESFGSSAFCAFLPTDPAALALPGGYSADRLHMTLSYFGRIGDLDPADEPTVAAAVAACAAAAQPFTGTVSDVGPLGEPPPVTVLHLDAPEAHPVHTRLVGALDESGIFVPGLRQFPKYLTHLTVGRPGERRIEELEGIIGRSIRFEQVAFVWGGQGRTYPLGS